MAKGSKKIKLTNDDDVFKGKNADEIVMGKGGDDSISGGNGNDKLNGGAGNDVLKGGNGDDVVNGGAGNDILLGGAGDDRLAGGAGTNTVNGGEGDDTVVFAGNQADWTIVKDGDSWVFTNAAGDKTTASGVEVVQFADGSVLVEDLDPTDPVGTTFTLKVGADTLTGTDQDDLFRAVTAVSLETEDVLDGGAGDDVLTIDDDGLAAGAAPIISNIETINNADGDDFDLDQVTGVTRINQSVNDGVFLNASLTTVFAAAGAASVDLSVEYSSVLTGTTDAANLAVAFTADAQTVNFDFGASAALLEAVNIDVAAITGGGSSIVEIDAGLDALTTITITGAGDASIASDGQAYISEATFTTFNAAAATGDIDTGLNGQEDVTVTFGAGDNELDAIGTESGLTITTGAGADVIDFADVANIDDATLANFASDIITITDFSTASDTLDIIGAGAAEVVLNNADQATIEGAATLFAAVTQAATFAADNEAIVFEYGGDAYIYVQDANAAFDAGDGLIKLTGVDADDLGATNLLFA